MSKLQATQGVKLSKVRDVQPEAVAPSAAVARGSRLGRASDEGVWTAALAIGFCSFLAPVWYLGVGTAYGAGADGTYGRTIHVVQLTLLIAGGLVMFAAAFSAWMLARAPRLEGRIHPTLLRCCAVGAAIGAAVFIRCCVNDVAGVTDDTLAHIASFLPTALMVSVSLALPGVSRGRHGVSIGRLAVLPWLAAGASALSVGIHPTSWWLPAALATAASYFTGTAALRLWRRYEGRIVQH